LIKKIFILTILLFKILFPNIYPDYYSSSNSVNSNNRTDNLKLLLGIMVEFKEEEIDDPLTTGDGTFLQSADLSYINYNEILKCSSTLIDSPPHDRGYFEAQLKAVRNYYKSITNDASSIQDLDVHMLEQVYQLDDYMQQYSYSDIHITNLFKEAIDLAKDDIINYVEVDNQYSSEDFIIVVFHAGLGQDISSSGGFDPTIYDIHSAYIEETMLYNAFNDSEIMLNDNISISNGIVLPEALNMIYYDIIEDIVPITFISSDDLENLYCDIQLGMTGLFAYLLGYRLGFPPMHSTDNIFPYTRIGKFGLMDQGSNNGRGLIPAPPHVWSRIDNQHIQESFVDKTDDIFSSDNVSKRIPKYSLNEEESIVKVHINDSEYFLLENRNNIIKENLILGEYENSISGLMDDLNCQPIIGGQENPYCDADIQDSLKDKIDDCNICEDCENYYWIDVITCIFGDELAIEHGVITQFPDYDYGFPGSGVLVWHINDNNKSDYGFNNNIDNRFIQLEEADGVVHIGYPDPDPFQRGIVPYGWQYDFWYLNNEAYEDINDSDDILFDNNSMPNSRTHNNINSNISFKITSSQGKDLMTVKIRYDNELIDIIDSDNIKTLGGVNDDIFFFKYNSQEELSVFKKSLITEDVSEENIECPPYDLNCDICKENNYIDTDDMIIHVNDDGEEEICIIDNDYYVDKNTYVLNPGTINPIGYLNEDDLQNGPSEFLDIENNTNYSLGDMDLDGLDEIISVVNGTLDVKNYNNNSSVSGFPVHNEYMGYALVADLFDGSEPEIICKTSSSIDIISYEGNIIAEYPLYNSNQNIFLLSLDNMMYLVNDNYYIEFDKFNANSNYWLNSYSTTYNYPEVTGLSQEDRQNLMADVMSNNSFGIDTSRSFNYPNPFENSTYFRFYVGSSNYVNISIYDILGILIDDIKITSLVSNEFNEYYYATSKLEPGVYIGQIKSDKGETKIIKMLKTK